MRKKLDALSTHVLIFAVAITGVRQLHLPNRGGVAWGSSPGFHFGPGPANRCEFAEFVRFDLIDGEGRAQFGG